MHYFFFKLKQLNCLQSKREAFNKIIKTLNKRVKRFFSNDVQGLQTNHKSINLAANVDLNRIIVHLVSLDGNVYFQVVFFLTGDVI